MNKEYKIKIDLNKKLYNKKMAFNQFDENVNDFYIEVTKNNEVVKDLDKSIITLVAIKPNGEVDAQFIEVKEGQIYADLKPSMCDLVGNYQAKAMIVLEGEIVTTDTINYSVNEDKIISRLNDDVVSDERFPLFTDALARLSDIEISEEQRVINEAERILSEENRKIEEAKRVEAELIRQHEEADRAKYDATRESNENIRKQNESIRLANETNRIDEEAKRVKEETKRVEAEQLRNANYNFMTEDEERRRSEANAHKEAETLRVQAETNRVNEEAKRRTTEQARVSAENTRVGNENTRKANETTRQTNETQRVEAETQRQNRYNSFIADAEANANNFENYTNTAKVKEEERKSNELDRKSQEARRVSNEVERISNENTRKANEKAREKNETSRQYVFENKVDEVDKKIIEINATKDNFVSSVNTKVDSKISELDNTKSDMATSINNKVNEVENRFNALTSKQQQDAEVIDARDGETSLKARLDRDIEKAKQVYVDVEGSHISSDSSVGYAKDVEILGNTIQDSENLADIRSVGDTVEGQELYEIPVVSCGKNLFNGEFIYGTYNDGVFVSNETMLANKSPIRVKQNTSYYIKRIGLVSGKYTRISYYDINMTFLSSDVGSDRIFTTPKDCCYINLHNEKPDVELKVMISEGEYVTEYEPYVEDKLTILSPVQLEKVGDVRDRIIEKDGVWGIEKNVITITLDGTEAGWYNNDTQKFYEVPIADIVTPNTTVICDKYIHTISGTGNETGKIVTVQHSAIRIYPTNYDNTTLSEFKKELNVNNVTIKYPTTQLQFIPLPHSQQVKLRTFASKTNISFLTEIEGTIKAQVPKSLGATVNTHTEQINNLNKELDRVKKLEESTVSTVTTESDFTTVEATSNGYFEDVKLEGKTLVNLWDINSIGKSGETVVKNNRVTITTTSNIYSNFFYEQKSKFKPSTEYTIIADVYKNTLQSNDIVFITSNSGANFDNRDIFAANGGTQFTITGGVVGRIVKKCTTISDFSEVYYSLRSFVANNSQTKGGELELTITVLEGDHTKNSPSYFEGLKSVGQSATTSEDTTDEIVVSSVKGDGNLFDGTLEVGSLNASGDTNWTPYVKTGLIRVKPSSEVICKIGKYKGENATSTDIRMAEYDMNKNFIKFSGETHKATVSDKTHYVKFAKKLETSDTSRVDINAVSDVVVVYGNKLHDIPHQSDKKRLLYYNEETQTWEKPILREWDSIEKHADGKYYYHQRSGEVVFNGSEGWSYPTGQDGNNTILLYSRISDTKINQNYPICDMFNGTYLNIWESTTDIEGILINHNKDCVLRLNKSRLATQDVAGFKKWLQANNVTVVYQLAEEKVYECTNIDLITYANETNFIVESSALSPKTTLKVHSNISNVVSLLQKKVSLLESNVTSYMTTQNRLMLASRYNSDAVSFKVDYAVCSENMSQENYDTDLYNLILNNILVGKDNYDYNHMFNIIMDYASWSQISWDQFDILVGLMDIQHNPPIEEIPTDDEIVEEIPNEIM